MPHLTFDTYFNDKAAYPIDVGVTVGVLPFEKFQAEVGLDFFFPYWGLNYFFVQPAGALQLNAKVGLVEGAFGEWFPGIYGGIYGVGMNQGDPVRRPARRDRQDLLLRHPHRRRVLRGGRRRTRSGATSTASC